MFILSHFIVLFFAQKMFLEIKANENEVIVKIKNGQILGEKSFTVDLNKEYYSFRGIPYAEPPLGDLRFRPPTPVNNWNGILNTTMDRDSCTQNFVEGSEDCLYLNVYTSNMNNTSTLPVMVWVHGGFFIKGSSNYTEYGPDYFLEQDVVVVTVNYRLGVFGFLTTEDESASGNWALKDVILALSWIKDNIEYFGGNSKRVILFGESAGSALVSYLVQSALAKDLFHGAIMQSGTSLDLWALSQKSKENAFRLGRTLDIYTNDSQVLIQRLQQVNYKKLQIASSVVGFGEVLLTNPRNGLVFSPTEEPNLKNSVVVNKSHENLKNGKFNKVPIIIGFNSQEGILFVDQLKNIKPYILSYDIFPSRLIPIDMNVDNKYRLLVALKIRDRYFRFRLITELDENSIQYITDDQFVRPINEAVRLMSQHTSVYYYRFSYVGKLGLSVGKQERPVLGVSHTEDLNYLWRRSTNIENPPQTDLLTRQRMIKLWTNFAKTLNPTPKPDPILQNATWIPATPKTQFYLDIGESLKMQMNLTKYNIEWWRDLYNEYGRPPYDTY